MVGMINCMKFRPKDGQTEALFKAFAEYVRDYPFDDMFFDMKLIFINMWNQYQGFAAGALDGYKDPKQKKAKENFYNLFQRSMETLHYSDCLDTFEEFINLLERK